MTQKASQIASQSFTHLGSDLPPAFLCLADGTVFEGFAPGATGSTLGEVVFNTSMTGYQEILTDPSYAQQIVTLTYPHIGNTGANAEDAESLKPQAAGLIVRDVPHLPSNFRMEESLPDYLKRNQVVAICGIDTRALTQLLREKGAQAGAIVAGEGASAAKGLELAKSFGGLAGKDLAKEVTCKKAYEWNQTAWALGAGYGVAPDAGLEYHVVAYDFGVKHNILRLLASRGCRVTVVPAQTPIDDVLKMKPDGVFLSNGPGDPEPCDYAIAAARKCLSVKMPLFGICLGHQILSLATGAKTFKMSYGHHGANHPVKDLRTNRVYITSQNHGFAVDAKTLPSNTRVTHVSLFDGSLQGIECLDAPAFSFQGHPEASPGPHDIQPLFDHFVELMDAAKR